MKATDSELEQIYLTHFPPLVDTAVRSSLSRDEAENLAHEVLVASLLQMPRISDLKQWLKGSMQCAVARRTRK